MQIAEKLNGINAYSLGILIKLQRLVCFKEYDLFS